MSWRADRRWLALCLALGLVSCAAADAQELTSPQDHFGFTMGADGKLARWDGIVAYFEMLDAGSERIQVFDLGKSTEGNPFLLAVISSEANIGTRRNRGTCGCVTVRFTVLFCRPNVISKRILASKRRCLPTFTPIGRANRNTFANAIVGNRARTVYRSSAAACSSAR